MKIKFFGVEFGTGAEKSGQVPEQGSPVPMPTASSWRAAASMSAESVAGAVTLAEYGDAHQLLNLYRDVFLDSHVQGEFQKRLLAALGDPVEVQPWDEKSAADQAAAEAVRRMVDDCENWFDGLAYLMRGTLWPVAIVEKIYRPAAAGSGLRYELASLQAVDDQLLDLRPRTPAEIAQATLNGQPAWEPRIRLYPVDPSGVIGMTSGILDPMRHLVYRGHVLGLPDCWGGPMRAILFWWLMGTMDRAWWARYLEKFGTPFLIGKTDANDKASVSLLEKAFSLATKLHGLVVGHETQVELKEAAAQGTGEAHERFQAVCKREISKLIVGQDLSSTSAPTGMGSGVAKLQGEVREDIRKFDQQRLGTTLMRQMVRPFLEINGIKGRVKILWGKESTDEAAATATVLTGLTTAGLQPTDEALPVISQKVGFQVERRGSSVEGRGTGTSALMGFSANAELGVKSAELGGKHPSEAIARAKAAALAQAFRGSMAPVREIIMTSHSEAEAMNRLRAFYADWDPSRTAAVLEEAMQICAAAELK